MTQVDLKSLIARLGPNLKAALESGAAVAMSNGHYTVEVEHWLLKILDSDQSDLAEVLKLEGVNPQDARRQLETAVQKFKGGNSRPPSLSPMLVDCAKNAWLLASVNHGMGQTLSSHLLAAVLSDDIGRRQLIDSANCLSDLNADTIIKAAGEIIGKTAESSSAETASSEGPGAVPAGAPGGAALDKFTINLTAKAEEGNIDPVLGRDTEIRQCIDILMRRRQNNPILTGEAGVGKTAVVEGLALRVSQGDVPEPLKGVVIRTLDLGLLQAGASVKGEFENRLRQVIDEVKGSPQSIIMFIDEAHTLIGAGGKEGQGDAANLLKPALARGELRTIAATTWAEYKKYFERDPALTRRFQVVKVEEPSEEVAIDMMRGLAGMLQSHHRVRIGDDAIVASVKLSHRYIPDRQLPDKSVSLLDTACARVSLSQLAKPAQVEDMQRKITQLETNLQLLERENAASGDQDEQIAALRVDKASCEQELQALTDQWDQEQQLISEITDIRQQLEDDYLNTTPEDTAELSEEKKTELRSQLKELQNRLMDAQGKSALMSPHVDSNAVAEVVGNWTGIPVGKMLGDEIQEVMVLKDRLAERVIGQDHALEAIAQVVATSRAGLSDPRKPTGVFMMIGTSGTGKTETALALADLLYGGEQNMTVINMSEFKEEHKISMLLGSPPGYIGFGEGGVLTEAARRKPYSVILLDEMEKAHPGVQDVFYNLFDKGTIKDGEGRNIDFKNTMIIMTTNAGENAIRAIMAQEETRPDPEVLLDSIRPELLKTFKPAFLGRCSLVTYFPLEDEQLLKICGLNMQRIERRVREHYGATFTYDEDVLIHIVARCQEADTGARNIENILSRSLLPELATHCLSHLGEGKTINKVHIGVAEDGTFSYALS